MTSSLIAAAEHRPRSEFSVLSLISTFALKADNAIGMVVGNPEVTSLATFRLQKARSPAKGGATISEDTAF